MTDPTADDPKDGRGLDPESFARFLERLSPDAEEAGRLYIRLHGKLVGFFNLRGVSDPERAADDTINVAAAKISRGAEVPDAGKYCVGIARNIARERWRRGQRETSSFRLFIESLPEGTDEEVERINAVLRPCFEQLDAEEQKLLADYCQVPRGRARAEHRRQLAEARKTTVLALRMRVTRLRSTLTECVKKRSREVLAQF